MSQDWDHSSLFVQPSIQDHKQGLLDATVILVLYGDYQCSQSADVYRLIKVIQRQLNVSLGEHYLCFIFRHFPQIQTRADAQRAAEAAEAAAAQGQFWQMHNILFEHQQALANGYLVEYANDIGLNMPQFLQAMSQHTYLTQVNEDIESGLNSGITVTPALFINGIRYTDRWNMEQLMTAIVTASN